MKNKKWNFLVYIHAILFLWALLFVTSVFVFENGKMAAALAWGNFLFLFCNLPFAAYTFMLKKKNYFSVEYEGPIAVLAILNSMVGIAAWIFVAMLSQSPKFG